MALWNVSHQILTLLVVALYCTEVLGWSLTPCPPGDEKCIISSINQVIETNFAGDPDINLWSIDPMSVKRMQIEQPKTSPVNINLLLENSTVLGYKEFRAYQVRGFGVNPEGKHEIYFQGHNAQQVGDYIIHGKVLILPIEGQGKSNLTLENVFLKLTLDADAREKDGSTYMHVKKVILDLNSTRLYMHFDNLFNGDKALGDNVNLFLNENWRDVYTELRSAVLRGFEKVFTHFIRDVFASRPYADFIKTDQK